MNKKLVRLFDIFTILSVLISQLGFMSGAVTGAIAAPTQDNIPTSPSFAGVTLSNVRVNNGSNIGFVSPGATFNLSMDYSIVDPDCPGCIDEIEIGFSNASAPFGCIYTGIPGVEGTSGSATIEVTAPSTPGIYYLAFDRAQHYSCGQALEAGWWNGAPGSNRYIASISTRLVVTTIADTASNDDHNDDRFYSNDDEEEDDDAYCDLGSCTLREAILDANAHAGLDYIAFNIPGEGVKTISLTSALPAITDPLIIDGYTQPGATPNTLAIGDNANIQIELNGDACTPAPCSQGLLISSGGSTIQGLAIHGNFNNGIEVNGAGNTLTGNFLGLKADGSPHGMAASGIYINNATDNTIGGNAPADRNMISANHTGIVLAAGAANAILGNNIFSNSGLGIDLAGDGVTFNHQGVIDGPNNYQNYPVLSVATSTGDTTRVGGVLNSDPDQNYTI